MDDASTGVDDADGLLFAPGTTALAPIPKQYSEYMSFAAEIVVRTSKVLGGRVLKICNRSSEEQAFCDSVSTGCLVFTVEAGCSRPCLRNHILLDCRCLLNFEYCIRTEC